MNGTLLKQNPTKRSMGLILVTQYKFSITRI